MIYEVSHRTTYRYSMPVSFSHHFLHLTPRSCPHQICHRTALAVSPMPTVQSSGEDYFGNPVSNITLQEQHRELVLHSRSVIEVSALDLPDPAATDPWDQIYDRLQRDGSESGLDAIQYAFDSPYTLARADLAGYAGPSFPPGRPIADGVLDLTRRIHQEFRYDSTATTVSTPVDDIFAGRRGVCQDFAHFEIACLRALGLPARYVSGYLLTRPPEGQERLVGADASHAWLSVWCPPHGWIDLDPTNNLVVSVEHVTLAWGRDYGDVSPIKGAIFGGGEHAIDVSVDVIPTEGHAALRAVRE
jgi:transglutaminase-like putative cysteine protease